jgi:hypothetical protein
MADCLCYKAKMFPYSGTYWTYYAQDTDNMCNNGYTTSAIAPDGIVTPQNCASGCVGCQALGQLPVTATVVLNSHLYFAESQNFAYLSDPSNMPDFLGRNTGLSGGDLIRAKKFINAMSFTAPEGWATPPAVQLTRKTSMGMKTFYAVLYKVQGSAGTDIGYMGLEVNDASDPSGGTFVKPEAGGLFRATVLAADDSDPKINQALIVKGLLEVLVSCPDGYQRRFYIRLLNIDDNKTDMAFPKKFKPF